jgi:hypothetical protein
VFIIITFSIEIISHICKLMMGHFVLWRKPLDEEQTHFPSWVLGWRLYKEAGYSDMKKETNISILWFFYLFHLLIARTLVSYWFYCMVLLQVGRTIDALGEVCRLSTKGIWVPYSSTSHYGHSWKVLCSLLNFYLD